MEAKVYIFGVPDGFDLYRGNAEETKYFQGYYIDSKENAKMIVQITGNVFSCTYLRYNLITGGGRGGAFFGISVFINNKYCTDMTMLYKLFESMFEILLEKNGKLLTKTSKDEIAYIVKSFKDAENKIKEIEELILQNLNTNFANDFENITGFKNGKPKILKIETDFANSKEKQKQNKAIITAFKESSKLFLSPEYNIKTPPPPADDDTEHLRIFSTIVERIVKELPLLNDSLSIVDTLLAERVNYPEKSSERKLCEANILSKYYNNETQYNNICDFITNNKNTLAFADKYSKKNPDLIIWTELHEDFLKQKQSLETCSQRLQSHARIVEKFENSNNGGSGKPNKTSGFGKKLKTLALVLLFVLPFGIFLKMFVFTSIPVSKQDVCGKLYVHVDSVFNAKNFEQVIQICDADTMNCTNIASLKKQAGDSLFFRNEYEQALGEYNKGGLKAGNTGTKQITAYKNALNKLTNVESERKDTVEKRFRDETIKYYEKAIENTTNKCAEKNEYANYIKNDLGDTNNAVAQAVQPCPPPQSNLTISITDNNANTSLSKNGTKYSIDGANSSADSFNIAISPQNQGNWSASPDDIIEINFKDRTQTTFKVKKDGKVTLTYKDNNGKTAEVKIDIKNTM